MKKQVKETDSASRDTLRVMLKHNGNIAVSRERTFMPRLDTAMAVNDPGGRGYIWLDTWNEKPVLAIEGPNGNATVVDLRIVLSLVVGMIDQAGKEAMAVKGGAPGNFKGN